MAFVRKLRRILATRFPAPDKIELRDDDSIIGVVTSSQFRRMEIMDRQNLLHDLLKTHLTPQEMQKVLLIAAVTPEEEIAHTAMK